MKTILIIGAGLGGLALAQLLQQELASSVKVIVFERDAMEDFRDQGYFITINQMGTDVLKRIPVVDDEFTNPSTMSYNQCQLKLADKSANTMLETTTGEIKVIERTALRRSLLKHIDVQWNKRFVSYNILNDGVEVHFEDGSSVQGTLLIGCDGAKSLVRAQLIPELQREDTGVLHIAGTIEQNEQLVQIKQLVTNSLVQVLGDQGHALFLISTGKLWLWSLSWPSTDTTETKITLTQLLDKVRANFNNEEFVRLIELSSSIRLNTLRIYSSSPLKVNPFPNNPQVTLLGDAAHFMTPQRGMGANTAFADALDLVNAIRLGHTKVSLADYEEKMYKRGFQAVRDSLQSTRMTCMLGLQARIRDYIFWFLHYSIALKNFVSMLFN
jgi:2-polyprenyl-6-methoxyphenol hydroxylase-like FAD-dependent oxidoreductase